MNEKNKNTPVAEEGEIDLVALAKSIWERRKFIIKTVLIFAVIGVIVALFSPTQYTASTKMVPQSSGGTQRASGGLSSLASMAGINLNMNQTTTELLPQTYPQILQSVPFQLKLMQNKFTFSDVEEPVTLFEYYTEYSQPGVLSLVKKYTIGLPGVISKAIKGDEEKTSAVATQDGNTIRLTKEQEEVRKIISDNISLEINDQDGFIQLNSSFHEAELSAEVAQKAQELLQEYITDFKIEKASEQLNFIEERYKEKKKEFQEAQAALAAFRDRNKNVTSAMALTEQERLQNEYQLAFEVYSNLAQQLEQARIKVKEDTPVFSVIQPVTVPQERTKPKRKIILIIWIFLGGIVAIGWVFASQYLETAKEHWKEIDTGNKENNNSLAENSES
ncbi:G-rich domain on putative tyrosine kinase [Tangfeifania diversioriginum]|uniref:G-rich domain on putative tyrosine kinase n=1 Tax=Tangfeifania diversioriginum TaxID=1168035 RepID=A0A1M6IYN6_9BACT|nr:Wzz/FepE/Etk N-terminal domain-containing protein [Tangfeifania diversioriginum]SHJ39536.1 G-rich domain on putative tyrosine kinase [Tangfeifania diversioriginum]